MKVWCAFALSCVLSSALLVAQTTSSQPPGSSLQPQVVGQTVTPPAPSPLLAAQLQIIDLKMQLGAKHQVAQNCLENARATSEAQILSLHKAFNLATYTAWVKDYEAANPGFTFDLDARRAIVKTVDATPPKP